MNVVKNWLRRALFGKDVALSKRRLERLMRSEGLSRSAAIRVTRAYFDERTS